MTHFNLIITIILMKISLVVLFEINDKPFMFCIDKEDKLDLYTECDWEYSTESLSEKLSRLDCQLRRNYLMLQLKSEDNYFKMEGLVFHSLQGSIYSTHCVQIDKVEVHEQVDSCSDDIYVTFELNGEIKNGFITNERIIRKKSKQQPCSVEPKHITIGHHEQLVKQKNKITMLKNEKIVDWESSNIETFLSKYESFSTTPFYRIILDLVYMIWLSAWLIYSAIFSATPKFSIAFKALVRFIYLR
jgi:hypothetical protein